MTNIIPIKNGDRNRPSVLRTRNMLEAKRLLASSGLQDSLDRMILELYCQNLSFNGIAQFLVNQTQFKGVTKNQVVYRVRKLLGETYSSKSIRSEPRQISLLVAYRESGLVKDKLDLFILKHRTRNRGFSSYGISSLLRKRKKSKSLTRKAIDLRLRRLIKEASREYCRVILMLAILQLQVSIRPKVSILRKKAS